MEPQSPGSPLPVLSSSLQPPVSAVFQAPPRRRERESQPAIIPPKGVSWARIPRLTNDAFLEQCHSQIERPELTKLHLKYGPVQKNTYRQKVHANLCIEV